MWRATLAVLYGTLNASAFQSTLSVWRATAFTPRREQNCCHFNPRSPCGERQAETSRLRCRVAISIHALRVESDHIRWQICFRFLRFQSTLSVWRATVLRPPSPKKGAYFNPRSPCGERPPIMVVSPLSWSISIHALRVESDRNFGRNDFGQPPISIHALRVESDNKLIE